ncbi:MAG: hypothetical protein V1732_02630 [Patescibacteria group bacterium]
METKNEEEKKIKTTGQKLKIGAIAVALVVVGLSAGYVLGVVGYIKVIGPYVSEMKYKAFLKDYLKPYEEDFTGGDTPEETIDLFIEALKKGDYELASKYFIISKQEIVKNVLKEKDIFEIVKEIEYAKENWKKEDRPSEGINFWYNTIKENVAMTNEINLFKNSNNKWKIESMYIYYLAE